MANQRALVALMHYIRREPAKMFRAGPISLWLRGGFEVDRVLELLEGLVVEGILREATSDELASTGFKHGYFLTEYGAAHLPPEDRSYGVL